MNSVLKLVHPNHYITDRKGNVESVVMDAKKFEALIELMEDYGLGRAMKRTLKDKRYSKSEALRFLGEE